MEGLSDLLPVVTGALRASLAPSTWDAYRRAWGLFHQFYTGMCGESPCLPYRSVDLLYFIAHLSARGLAPATITCNVSAISFLHKINQVHDPADMMVVQKMLQGLRKQKGTVDARLPITSHFLSLIHFRAPQVLSDHYDVLFIRALALVAFHGFFRMGELVNKHARKVIQVDSVRYDQGGMNLIIPCSKTSPGEEFVYIRRMTGSAPCPVEATQAFLRMRGNSRGPLFARPDGSAPTHSRVSGLLGTIFQACGLDIQRYKGHSFRIGAASEAAQRGFSDAQIRLMGRWKSDAFKKYIRLPF